jgi:hypothetical protein
MRCAHPMCHRGIGLVSHRRSWFGKRLYCSRACRDNYAAELPRPRLPRSSFEPSLFTVLVAPSRPLARLGLVAGLSLVATLVLADRGSAAGHHVAGGNAASAQIHQLQSPARRCDPPPCPMRGNAALPRK